MFDLSAFALLLEKMIFFINALTQKDNRSVITSEHNIVVALFFCYGFGGLFSVFDVVVRVVM